LFLTFPTDAPAALADPTPTETRVLVAIAARKTASPFPRVPSGLLETKSTAIAVLSRRKNCGTLPRN
jgi:hypothetical protein